jgi:hypothetical protein
MKAMWGLCLAGLLAGCSTSPVSPAAADKVPASRYAYRGDGASTIVVTRDSGAFGSGCNYRFYIDGQVAAEFASGEAATFKVEPGRHILGINPSTMCGGGTQIESEIELKPGESARRRISLNSGGFYLTPTAY